MNNENSPESNKKTVAQRIRAKLKRQPRPSDLPLRITKDNIEEHRRSILAQGRKLKYPFQYSKKRMLVITFIMAGLAIIAIGLFLHNGLYRQQQTSNLFYSATKLFPVWVARVDGEPVRYQDYLRRIRADIFYYVNKEGRSFASEEGKHELNFHKRNNLNATIRAAYVAKLAREQHIELSAEQIDQRIAEMRQADGASKDDLAATLANYYGWTIDDFRVTTRDQLLEQRLVYKIDSAARDKANKVADAIKSGQDFAKLAEKFSDDEATNKAGGRVVTQTNTSDPTGIVKRVQQLQPGQTTGIEQTSVSGKHYYYFAKLNSKSDNQVDYSIIMVRLSKLDNDLATVIKQGKVQEYIKVPQLDQLVSSGSDATDATRK